MIMIKESSAKSRSRESDGLKIILKSVEYEMIEGQSIGREISLKIDINKGFVSELDLNPFVPNSVRVLNRKVFDSGGRNNLSGELPVEVFITERDKYSDEGTGKIIISLDTFRGACDKSLAVTIQEYLGPGRGTRGKAQFILIFGLHYFPSQEGTMIWLNNKR